MAAALVAAGATGLGLPAFAAEKTRNVLVFYSYSRMQPAIIEGDRGLRQGLRATIDVPVLVFDESLDAPRFGGQAYESVVVTYLREKYASRPPEVIVAVGEHALHFLLRHRREIPAGVPIVHAGVEAEFLRSIPPLPADVVGVPFDLDFSRTVDLALRWHPRARRLVIVTGTTEIDRKMEARLRAEALRFEGRAKLEFLAGLPIHEVLQRLAGLGPDAVVFTPGMYRDGSGRNLFPRDSAAAMAAVSTAPVYGPFSSQMGIGVVGGYMPSFEEMGRQAAQSVNEILAGASPASLRLPRTTPQMVNVDWRQVRRWGIDEGAIPADAIVQFRPPPLLEAYRNDVIGVAAVVLLQAGLIALLLLERRRRRAAEAVQQVQRRELAHVSRLAVAGELTGSIAHEINQPLGAILSNADAAELVLDSGTNRREEIRTILADIRRDDRRASEVVRRLRTLLAKHEVERRVFDLNEVVRDVQSILDGDARRHRAVLLTRPAPKPATIVGDPIQIQQVLINVVLNAMDAVAGLPEERRTIAVSVENGAGRVAVAVRDQGHGIAPEHLPRMFDSFFTTKHQGMGLGLSIARTLVDAHDGRIWAENGPGAGAVFHIEFPAAGEDGTAKQKPS